MNKEYSRPENIINELQLTEKIRFAKTEFRFYSESITKSLFGEIPFIKIADSILEFYKQIDFINLFRSVADNNDLVYLNKDLDFIGGSLNISTFTFFVETIINKNSQSLFDPDHNLNRNDYETLSQYFLLIY